MPRSALVTIEFVETPCDVGDLQVVRATFTALEPDAGAGIAVGDPVDPVRWGAAYQVFNRNTAKSVALNRTATGVYEGRFPVPLDLTDDELAITVRVEGRVTWQGAAESIVKVREPEIAPVLDPADDDEVITAGVFDFTDPTNSGLILLLTR